MWLLNTKTLELRYFNGPKGVSYAILSHVWEDADREYNFQSVKVTFEKYRDSDEGAVAHAPEKIRKFCLLAADEGFDWAWLDTACIDKTSSAELSEAINSMYSWYEGAARCYAYLYDVPDDDNPFEPDSAFRTSEYHERGWTLQELLASYRVVFLSTSWSFLGTKYSLVAPLAGRTGIDGGILLRKQSLDTASVAQRMSWAAHRVTTRDEDRAYSLMGIFGVTMPIIYGEGGERAFLRLQKEIIATCPDQSIFAWGSIHPDFDTAYDAIQRAQAFAYAGEDVEFDDIESLVAETDCNLLAKSPSHFASCAGMRRVDSRAFLDLTDHSVDYRCTFSADGITLYLPVSSHSMRMRDYTSVSDTVRVVRAAALACTTAPGTSDISIIILFLSGSPSSLDSWEDFSRELFSDAVGLLATREPSPGRVEITLSHGPGWPPSEGFKDGSGTFYRGATLHLAGTRRQSKDQQPATRATLNSFRSVRSNFHKRELRIQHPATTIVTFRPWSEPWPRVAKRQSEFDVFVVPNWVFHRLDDRYGFAFSPSSNSGSRTMHRALRITRYLGTPLYLLFVNAKSTTTLGIAIGAPCGDRNHRFWDSLSLRVFLAPIIILNDCDDMSGVEAALEAHELLPKDSQTACGRAHLPVDRSEAQGNATTQSESQGGRTTHFAFPTGPATPIVHVWCAGVFDVLANRHLFFTRVFNISVDLCPA